MDKKYIDNLFKSSNNKKPDKSRKESISSDEARENWKRLSSRLKQLGLS